MEEQIIRGSVTGYERFMKSVIWNDMREELEVWKRMAESEYKEATDMTQIARIQGRVEAVEYMLQMPRMLLDAQIASTDINYSKES